MVWTRHKEFASSQEPCRHLHQRWRLDMKSGTCADCGSVLLPELEAERDLLYKALLEADKDKPAGSASWHPV